jgi:predicted TIM-barrel fold metal-dependent hydrolase
VIDHFARIGGDGQFRDSDIELLCSLARHPHVHVKTSAFYYLGAKKPPYTDVLPMIRRMVECFGPQRLMWASDNPFQVQPPHTYEASLALVRDRLDFLSAADRQWLLERTAAKLFFD